MHKLNSYAAAPLPHRCRTAAAPLRFAFVTSREQKQKKKQNKTKEANKKKEREIPKKTQRNKKKQIYLYASKTFHIYIKYIPWAMNISFYLIVLLIAMLLIEGNTFFLIFLIWEAFRHLVPWSTI